MKLKSRQLEAYNAIFTALDRGIDRQLVALPTGVGKTVLGAHVATQFDRVLFLAHRQELIEQTARTMAAVAPDRTQGRIEPGSHELGQFTVAMLPTVYRRLERIPKDAFDCVIVDESHHAASRTWREVLDHFEPRLRLGLTATPERLDGLALSNLFSEIVYSMTLADAVNENLLVPPSAIQCLTSVNISAVHTRGGDLAEDELAALVDDPARNAFIAQKYLEHCPGRRAIAFCVNIAHAKHLVEACIDAGISAEWISGDDPLRADKLARFANGEFQVLANCQILTEGFDDKAVDAILLCRPTKSRSLFCQMIGRGLRLNDGKADCRILDFVDVAGKHSLMSAWKFFGFAVKPEDGETYGIQDVPKKRESKVAAVDIERAIDLLKPPEMPTLSGQWQFAPASDKQLAFLDRLGYDVRNNDFTKGQAASVISSHPVTSWQLVRLERLGYDVSGSWNRGQYDVAINASRASALSALDKMRRAGFQVELVKTGLRIVPDQLSAVQADWVKRNEAGLRLALSDKTGR